MYGKHQILYFYAFSVTLGAIPLLIHSLSIGDRRRFFDGNSIDNAASALGKIIR
jgi:hypothetical protein